MKRNIIKTLLLVAVGIMTACSSDNDIAEPQQPTTETVTTPVTITATYGDAQTTRTAYSESGNDISATWESGDEVLVVYDGHVSTLALTDGAGTASATFTGSITGTPTAQSLLSCYVRNANNPDALTVSGGDIIYSDAAFLAQDGTLAAAAKCNTHSGSTTYGDGTGLHVAFAVNTSMLKFTVLSPYEVAAGTENTTLTYTSGETTLAKATFTVGAGGTNTIYMAVPAGQYTGAQTLVYQAGETVVSRTLSASKANFTHGQTYSKQIDFDDAIQLSGRLTDYTVNDGDALKGTLVDTKKIYIPDGFTVTFRGMEGNVICQGSATIILADGTTNTVNSSGIGNPCINVPSGSTLTIKGTGSLNVTGTPGDAAIGSGLQSACGNIVIEGGNITAYGGEGAAGIGSGRKQCTCGDITISGGNITAYGGERAAGIGSGSGSSCGNITISGGSVTAWRGILDAPYSIGKGADYYIDLPSFCGTITIGGTVYSGGIYESPFTWTAP